MNSWNEYVEKVSRGRRAYEVARDAGMHPSNLSMWKRGTVPTPKVAVQFARGLGENVLEALVAAGLITAEEARIRTVVRFEDRLVNLSTAQLLAELGRRAGV